MYKIIGAMRRRSKSGFTLTELVVTLTLTAVVLIICARLFFSADGVFNLTDYFSSQEIQTRYTAETINNAIKYTNALFTIPHSSFTEANLTEGWSYVGVMDNVQIPDSLSGETGLVADALVYFKYAGSNKPGDADYVDLDTLKATLNSDQIVIENSDGYFIETVFGYSHVDSASGYHIEYELVFNSTNAAGSLNITSDSITYEFKLNYYDDDGNKVGEGSYIQIDTMLNGLNMLQAVYHGTASDPATAIAFHEDGFDVTATKGTVQANIVLVLDISNSMRDTIGGGSRTTRISALKDSALAFLDKFDDYDTVNIGIVAFGMYGISLTDGAVPAKTNSTVLKNAITNICTKVANQQIQSDFGGTNMGDGVRIANYMFDEVSVSGVNNYIVIISDGSLTAYSTNKPSEYKYPTSSEVVSYYFGEALPGGVLYPGQSEYYVPVTQTGTINYRDMLDTYSIGSFWDWLSGYSMPTLKSSYCFDYLRFCAAKVISGTDYDAPKLFLMNIMPNSSGGLKNYGEIIEAFGGEADDTSIDSSTAKAYYFAINDATSFLDSMTKVAANISTSAWLLDGPRT